MFSLSLPGLTWSLCPGGPIKLLHITQHCNIVTEVTEEPRSCGCIDDHHDICPVSYKPDQLSGIYYSANQCMYKNLS